MEVDIYIRNSIAPEEKRFDLVEKISVLLHFLPEGA